MLVDLCGSLIHVLVLHFRTGLTCSLHQTDVCVLRISMACNYFIDGWLFDICYTLASLPSLFSRLFCGITASVKLRSRSSHSCFAQLSATRANYGEDSRGEGSSLFRVFLPSFAVSSHLPFSNQLWHFLHGVDTFLQGPLELPLPLVSLDPLALPCTFHCKTSSQ